MKTLTKVLSMLLVIVMCVGCLGMSAFADEVNDADVEISSADTQDPADTSSNASGENDADSVNDADETKDEANAEAEAAETEAEEDKTETESNDAEIVDAEDEANDAEEEDAVNTVSKPSKPAKTPAYTPSVSDALTVGISDPIPEGQATENLWFTCQMMEEFANQGGVPRLIIVKSGSAPTSGGISNLDWYIVRKNGKYTETAYISAATINKLPAGDYDVYILCDGVYSSAGAIKIEAPSFYIGAVGTDTHAVTSDKSLKFRANKTVEKVFVGGTKVNQQLEYGKDFYFTTTNESNDTVVLTADFLGERTPGATYTLYVKNGDDVASTTFKITGSSTRTVGTSSTSPRTADESNIGLWAALLLLSGAAVVVCVPKLRKHKG
ncbi:MAG: hypothetical protein IJV41_11660 [Oscillospiraceae bacterium]|nr:hypothetical protein [Oscillospiraceae bacterium]